MFVVAGEQFLPTDPQFHSLRPAVREAVARSKKSTQYVVERSGLLIPTMHGRAINGRWEPVCPDCKGVALFPGQPKCLLCDSVGYLTGGAPVP